MRNRKKRDGRGRRLRLFAWILALLLAITGWFLGGPAGLACEFTAAVVFALGTVWPYAFNHFHRLIEPSRKRSLRHPS